MTTNDTNQFMQYVSNTEGGPRQPSEGQAPAPTRRKILAATKLGTWPPDFKINSVIPNGITDAINIFLITTN